MRFLFLFVSLFLTHSSLAFPLESKNGKTEFLATGRPSALKIMGQGAGPLGQMNLSPQDDFFLLSGEANVDLESLNTGLSLRDQHMKKKYLEVGKSKTATLKFSDVKLARELIDKGGEIQIPGILQLHGQEKPVEVHTQFVKEGNWMKTTSSFQIKISDYGIAIPSFSGITVADLVQIKIETQISKSDLTAAAAEKK